VGGAAPSGGESNHETSAFTLDYIKGTIRVTFRGDGSVEVVYDKHERREYADRTMNVGDVQIERHEEFTQTPNTCPFDGALDVCIIENLCLLRFLWRTATMYFYVLVGGSILMHYIRKEAVRQKQVSS
jgi:hypothetical protein